MRFPDAIARRVSLLALGGLAVVLTGCATPSFFERAKPSLAGSYLSGRVAAQRRMADEAAFYYERALALSPDDPALLQRAFLLDIAAGRVDAAADLAVDILEADYDEALPHLVLAIELFRKGDYGEARARLQEGAYGPFNSAVAALMEAWTYAGEGRFEDALDRLDANTGIEIYRGFHGLHRAMIIDLSGDLEAAAEAYRAAGRGAVAPAAARGLGIALERSGDAAAARALYEADIERTRRNVHAWQGLKRLDAGRAAEPFVRTASDGAAMAFFNLAAALAGERGLETPLIYARLALRLRPDFDEAYALIGQMYESADLQNLAVAAYAQARPGTPVYETAQIGLANALKDMDRTDEAIAMLSRLTEGRVQDYPYAAMRLGDLLSVDERHDDAIAVYDTAIAAFADMPGDAVWPYYFARGAAKLSADDWPGAEADLLTAYDAAPDNPYVLNFLGYSWIERSENLQKAFAMIEKAVALRPRDGAIVDSLGWGYYQLGDYAAAVAHLERAAALSSGDPTINDHLGDAYWRTGRYIEARFQWRRVLQLDPKPKLAAEAERKLEFGLDEAPALDDEAPR